MAWYQSSTGSGKTSLTIKGLALGIIPLVIFAAGFAGVSLTETELVEFVEAISGALAAIMVVYGLGRKLAMKFKKS